MAKKPTEDLFESSTMTFGEHLEELRVCLFRGVIGIAVGVLVGFFVANAVVRFFQSPLERAMERFYVKRALGDYEQLFGQVPVEVRRMIVDEGLVPEPLQLEAAQVAQALKQTYPQQFSSLEISPYWFTAGDLLPGGEQTLARRLVEEGSAGRGAYGRLWQLLDPAQQKGLKQLAARPATTNRPLAEDQTLVLGVLNTLAGRPELHQAQELADLSGPDQDFAAALGRTITALVLGSKRPQGDDTIAQLRAQLAQHNDPETSRRLNKLLLARLFPDALRKARVNLLSVYSWRPVRVRFQVLNAQEAFMIWMKAALMTGLVLASPWVFYQIWVFVAAGLYPHEKHYVYLYLPISVALFLGGASLAFLFVFDPVLDFLFTFNQGMNADFDPRVGEWLGFVLILPLGFGISFQLPLVMLFLNRLGLASLEFYVQQWRIAVLVICVISMVLTPADPVSMLLMAVPLCLLYLLGIGMCLFMPRPRNPFAEAYEP
jgi:sec-independent protein translocase protein TatC